MKEDLLDCDKRFEARLRGYEHRVRGCEGRVLGSEGGVRGSERGVRGSEEERKRRWFGRRIPEIEHNYEVLKKRRRK